MRIRCQTLSLVFFLLPLFFIFSDLINGLILLMNSNFSEPVNIVSIKWIAIVMCFSEPVNIVSIKWIVIVMCYRAYEHVTAQFAVTHPIITDRLSRR